MAKPFYSPPLDSRHYAFVTTLVVKDHTFALVEVDIYVRLNEQNTTFFAYSNGALPVFSITNDELVEYPQDERHGGNIWEPLFSYLNEN